MDRFEAMNLLREAVDCGSLSAASRRLRVPLPTLSRKISELESIVGAKLLVRTTRRLALTDAGAVYLAAARRILDEVESAEREAAGEFAEPKGELVLTAPIHFGRLHVLPVVAAFLDEFPQVDVRLVLADRNVHLVDDQVDMAVRIGPLVDSAMIATRIGAMRTVVVASPDLLTKHGVPTNPANLEGFPGVAVDGPMATIDWRFSPPGRAAPISVRPVPRLTVSTTEAAADAAIRGVGIVRLLHYQVVEAIEDGRLRLLLADFEPDPVPVHLIHAAHGRMPLKLRRFIDVAAPALRDRLAKLSLDRN